MTAAGAYAKPIHVSMFTPTPDGGHARYTKELLLELAAEGAPRGVSVSLATSTNLDSVYYTDRYPVHAFLAPTVPRDDFRSPITWAVSRLRHYWRRDHAFVDWATKNRITAVHVQEYTPWNAIFDFRRLRRRGVRVFATVHNIRWNDYPPFMPRWLPDLSNRMAWRACDGLFVHTESLKDALSKRLGPGHPPIFVTEHGAWSVDQSAPAAAGADERRSAKKLLLYGAHSPYKGLNVMLKAMHDLPGYTLTIAGPFDDEEVRREAYELAEALPPGTVTMIEKFYQVHEIAPLFAEHSALMMPYTRFFAQSGVLHDAVTCGIPVVGTNLGALGESVRSWGIGTAAEANDPVAFAAAVKALFEPETYRAAIAATETVRAEKSWRKTAVSTLAGYEAVIRTDG